MSFAGRRRKHPALNSIQTSDFRPPTSALQATGVALGSTESQAGSGNHVEPSGPSQARFWNASRARWDAPSTRWVAVSARVKGFQRALEHLERGVGMFPACVGTLPRRGGKGMFRILERRSVRWEESSACWEQLSACCKRPGTCWRESKTRRDDPDFWRIRAHPKRSADAITRMRVHLC